MGPAPSACKCPGTQPKLSLQERLKAALETKEGKGLTLSDVYKKFTEFQKVNVALSPSNPNPSVNQLRRAARAVTIYQKLFKREYNSEGPNGPLFMVLALLRKVGPSEDKVLHPHPTTVKRVPMEWYEVNAQPSSGFLVYVAHLAILEMPPTSEDLRSFDESFYDMLIKDRHFPVCQKTKDQWEFVLSNVDAFCTMDGTKKVCDLSWMNKYDVELGYHKYGGKLIVDGEDISIDGLKPADGDKWEEAKWTFCSTFGTQVEHATHGCVLHIGVMQFNLLQVLEDAALQALCLKNPEAETMVKILTCNMNETNINFKILAGYGRSLAQRSSAFTVDGLDNLSKDIYKEWTALKPEDVAKRLGTGAPKWNQSATAAWEAAKELIDSVIPADAGVKTKPNMTLMLWASSFYHTLVGDLQSDNLLRGHMNMVCTGKPHVQSRSFAYLAGTMVNMIIKRTLSLGEIIEQIDLGNSKAAWEKFTGVIKGLDTGIPSYDKMLAYPAVNF